MGRRKLTDEERAWRNERAKIRRKEKKQQDPTNMEDTDRVRKKKFRAGIFSVDSNTGYWNCGAMNQKCNHCDALHFLGEKTSTSGSTLKNPKFALCCSNGQVTPHFLLQSSCSNCNEPFTSALGILRSPFAGESCKKCGFCVPRKLPTFPEPPALLRQLLTLSSKDAKHFRRYIRLYNSTLAVASVRANFVERGPGSSKFFPTVTVHGRMYHQMGALIPPQSNKPRFAAVYIHDTDHAALRKYFYSDIREDLLEALASMLHAENKLVQTFVSLRDLIKTNNIPDDVRLVIHAHERTKPGHERKYNVPEASEVAALIVGEQHGALDIVLRRHGSVNANGLEKLDIIRMGHRMFDPLSYPLLFPFGEDGWHSKLMHNDSKGKQQKVSPLKFYARLLFQRECDFNILLHCGRLFQQFLCEMFVKVEFERLSFLRQNQTKLRSCDYTHLCELLADAASIRNEAQAWTSKTDAAVPGDIGKLVVLPSTHIGSDRYM